MHKRYLLAAIVTIAWIAATAGTIGCNKSGTSQSSETANETTDSGNDASSTDKPETPQESDADRQYRELHPQIVIETNYGNIPVELDRENAPQTVDHFLDYVARGFYDNTLFHQVFKDYAIIGGLMDVDFQPKEVSDTVRNEARNGLKNLRGTISMLRQPEVIDSATTQFFINLKDNPELDYKGWNPDDPNADPADYGYCVFGKVIGDGMQVVDKIAQVPVKDTDDFPAVPQENVIITKIRIVP